MKKQVRVFNIDVERLNAALNNWGDANIKRALVHIKENLWIFNMTYDPQKEGGYMTSNQPIKISEFDLDTYQAACNRIGARLEVVGPDLF